jgi:hypothetical protein
MSIENARRPVSKLRQERHWVVHAMPDMPLLTELDRFAGGDVSIDMPLLTELPDGGIPLKTATRPNRARCTSTLRINSRESSVRSGMSIENARRNAQAPLGAALGRAWAA